jgi:hypothetical protein
MPVSRRSVLGAAALLQSNLLGGCFGGSDGTQAGTASDDGGGDSGNDATATPTPTTTPTATATPAPRSPLAAATTDALAEYEWFRTEHAAAIQGFRSTVNGVIGVVEELEAAETRSRSAVEALRTAAADVADYVNGRLADHFVIDRALRVADNVYVRDFERAVARGDVGLQDSVLARTRAFYRRAVSRTYVEHEFSRRPIYGPLYETLVPGERDRIVALTGVDDDFVTWAHPDRTESTADDGVAQHVHEFPGGYRTFVHAHEHSTAHRTRGHSNEPPYDRLYAYGDDGVALLQDTASWRERLDDFEPMLTGLFGPVQSPGRTLGVYAFVGGVDESFTDCPLYVEQFDSASAARSALVTSEGGSGDVVTEGTETFANREWTRVLYDLDGTTVYAYRIRAGPTVVTTLPSDVPWENRGDWTVGLGPTWIGATASDG